MKMNPFKLRIFIFCVVLIAITAWNMALSSRRKYYSGHLVKAVKESVLITAQCPGKIEPRVQASVRSLIKGRKIQIHVKEGDSVREGDLLMDISDEDIRLELKQKQVAHDNAVTDSLKASKDFRLAKSLYKQGAVPLRELEDSKQTFVRSQQAVDTVSDELALLKKKAKGVKVYSPMKGVVIKSYIADKEDIAENEELFRVAKLDDLILRGLVDELKIAQVKPAQSATIECDAFAGIQMPGRVNWIGAQAKDGVFAEVEVKIDILDSKKLDLKPNLTCHADIITGNMPDSIVIPIAGVRYGQAGPYVLRTHPAGWIEETPVRVVSIGGARVVVTEGLEAGERILVPEAMENDRPH